MTRFVRLFVVAMLLAATACVHVERSQFDDAPIARSANGLPDNVRLMDGWKHERLRGIDSTVGRFVGERGFEIYYDMGGMAGNWAAGARKRNDVAWSREQTVNGARCEIVMTNGGRIIATYPERTLNFFAEIKSPEDMADFMLLAMTYSPTP